MPHPATDDAESVFLNQMPEKSGLTASDAFTAKWNLIEQTRLEVNKVLESKRNEKVIGKSLEAAVTIAVSDADLLAQYQAIAADLETVLIVSSVQVVQKESGETTYSVEKASGEKCERCWCYSETVGKDAAHPTLCARCAHVIQ